MVTRASGLDIDADGKFQIRLYYDTVADTPIVTLGSHMVWGIFDASGHLLDQANFVAYDRDTKKADLAALLGNNQLIFVRTADGSARDVGLDGSLIPPGAVPAATFTLDPADALERWQNLITGGEALNRANVNYLLVPRLGGANSNSGAAYGARWMNLDVGEPHSGSLAGPVGVGDDLMQKLSDAGVKIGGVPIDEYFRRSMDRGKTVPLKPDAQKRGDNADPTSTPLAEGDSLSGSSVESGLGSAAAETTDSAAAAPAPDAASPAPQRPTLPLGDPAADPVAIADGGGAQAADFLAGRSEVNPVTVNLARMRSPGDIENGLGTVASVLPVDTVSADHATRLAAGMLALDPRDVAGTIGSYRSPAELAAMHLMLDSAGAQLLDHAGASADPKAATDDDDMRFASAFAATRAMQQHFEAVPA
jgi:hypothetical protein